MNVVQGIYAFLLGMVLGWLVEKYGHIREAVILHTVVNFSGCVVGYIMPEVVVETWFGLIFLLVFALIMLVFSVKTVKMEEIEVTMIDISEEFDDGTEDT